MSSTRSRRQRLHALDHDALGELTKTSARPGCATASSAALRARTVGEQHLAAGRRPQPVLGDLERTLVGDLEPADLLYGVAPHLDPQRVLVGGREHVDDPATDGELAAPLDQVHPGVRRGRQPARRHRRGRPRRRDAEPPARARRGPATIGCSTARTGATTTCTGPCSTSSASGCASRRRTASRRPTVSLRGLSRSCGSVSQAGNSTTELGSSRSRSAVASSSASRPVAVTASTGRPALAVSAASANGRIPGGAVRSRSARPPDRADSTARRRAGSPAARRAAGRAGRSGSRQWLPAPLVGLSAQHGSPGPRGGRGRSQRTSPTTLTVSDRRSARSRRDTAGSSYLSSMRCGYARRTRPDGTDSG